MLLGGASVPYWVRNSLPRWPKLSDFEIHHGLAGVRLKQRNARPVTQWGILNEMGSLCATIRLVALVPQGKSEATVIRVAKPLWR